MMVKPKHCPAPLAGFIQPILGLTSWGVKQGYGSFLTFEFGQPKLEIREHTSKRRRSAYVQGDWHLWIYCCHWRILQDGEQIAWSEDAPAQILQGTDLLNGQNWLELDVLPQQGRSTFSFDLGGLLETWPYGSDQSDEQWKIYSNTEVFTYNASGSYAREPVETRPEEVSWLPLS